MGVAAPARLKLVACCVHSSHNAGDRSTKVGRKISRPTQNVWFANVFSTFRCQNSVVKIWQLVGAPWLRLRGVYCKYADENNVPYNLSMLT